MSRRKTALFINKQNDFHVTLLIGSVTAESRSISIMKGCTHWLEAHSPTIQCCLEGALACTRFHLRCPTPVLFYSLTTCWLRLIDQFELHIDCVGLLCSLAVSSEALNSPNVPRWEDWFCVLSGNLAQMSSSSDGPQQQPNRYQTTEVEMNRQDVYFRKMSLRISITLYCVFVSDKASNWTSCLPCLSLNLYPEATHSHQASPHCEDWPVGECAGLNEPQQGEARRGGVICIALDCN